MNPMPDDVKEMLGIPIQSKSRSRSEPRTPRKTPSKVILVRHNWHWTVMVHTFNIHIGEYREAKDTIQNTQKGQIATRYLLLSNRGGKVCTASEKESNRCISEEAFIKSRSREEALCDLCNAD